MKIDKTGFVDLGYRGWYDPKAPKFRYVRDSSSFTRKTSRVKKGEELTLLGVSVPSSKTRAGSKFPWTKPMPGWKRVYVGQGRWRAKGRMKRSIKPGYLAQTIKPFKRKFIPYPHTYGWGEVHAK